MPTTTTHYSLLKPLPFDLTDADQWGGQLNSDLDAIDALFYRALNFTTLSKGGNYTVTTSDYNSVIFANATTASFTIALPDAVGIAGFTIAIKKVDGTANTVTIDPAGLETIDGQTTLVLSAQYEDVTLVSDGANWSSISKASIASQLEAETGTNNTKTMTPLRTFQAITEWTLNNLGFNKRFDSGNITVTPSSTLTPIAHGLGVIPSNIQWFLVCTTTSAANGYVAGDIMPWGPYANTDSGIGSYGFGAKVNATNVTISITALAQYMATSTATINPLAPFAINWANYALRFIALG